MGLEARGFIVVALESPLGSAIVIGQERPDAVLVDMTMASMSGEAVVKALKAKAKGPGAPCVLLFSDRPERDLLAAAQRSGADGWVRKSSDVGLIADALTQALAAK